jgi:hypothetical protein
MRINHHNQQDIRVIPANPYPEGHDHVIGDLHGNSDCLKSVINKLNINDRLFLVGDLVDRGADSLGIIRLIQENDARIFSVRGNHESMCLNTITSLEKIAQQHEGFANQGNNIAIDVEAAITHKDSAEFYNKYGEHSEAILHHVWNGGIWLVELFQIEFNEKKILISESRKTGITYSDQSNIKRIKEFMEHLPYIIHVAGNKPFNIVHADMPFDDLELQKRISTKEGLTEDEKIYATWARIAEPGIRASNFTIHDKNRNNESVPTFVGHSIIDRGDVPAVRETNTYDIDVGATYNNFILLVNITKGSANFVGSSSVNEHLLKAQLDINAKLQNKK